MVSWLPTVLIPYTTWGETVFCSSISLLLHIMLKVRQSRNDFFKPTILLKNEFDFTTMIPQVDLFSFVFWKKSKTPRKHFKIN